MYLRSLAIERFRSCQDTTVRLRSDLTVLVGENNGGKSNIIDALRLLTIPLSGRRERYPEDDDLQRESTDNSSFLIEGCFTGLSDTLKGLLISWMPDPTADSGIVGMKHMTRAKGQPRGKTTYWAGKRNAGPPEVGSLELVRHVFLPPLRDAHQALGSGSATRIRNLLGYFLEEGDEKNFIADVQRPEKPHEVLTAINTEIGGALGDLTRGGSSSICTDRF